MDKKKYLTLQKRAKRAMQRLPRKKAVRVQFAWLKWADRVTGTTCFWAC